LATRIYTLAKELKLDNKVLVDICNKIGITGKGSALASLSDEEVATIKAHLGDGGKKAGGGTATLEGPMARAVAGRGLASPAVARRDDHVVPSPVSKKVPQFWRSGPRSRRPRNRRRRWRARPLTRRPRRLPQRLLRGLFRPPRLLWNPVPAPAAGEVPVAGLSQVDASMLPAVAAFPEAAATPAGEPALLASATAPPPKAYRRRPTSCVSRRKAPAAAPSGSEPGQQQPAAVKSDRMIRPLRQLGRTGPWTVWTVRSSHVPTSRDRSGWAHRSSWRRCRRCSSRPTGQTCRAGAAEARHQARAGRDPRLEGRRQAVVGAHPQAGGEAEGRRQEARRQDARGP
jgi:hypothetical protein